MSEEFANRYKYYEEIRSITEYIRSIVEEEKPIEKIEFIQEEIYAGIDSSRWMMYAPDLVLAYSDNGDAWAENTTLVEVAESSEEYLPRFHSILAFSVMETDILQDIDYLERLERAEKKGLNCKEEGATKNVI